MIHIVDQVFIRSMQNQIEHEIEINESIASLDALSQGQGEERIATDDEKIGIRRRILSYENLNEAGSSERVRTMASL